MTIALKSIVSDHTEVKPLTVEEVEAMVAEIEAQSGDFEVAHSLEDRLYLGVLRNIAKYGRGRAAALARAAIKADTIIFPRWRA